MAGLQRLGQLQWHLPVGSTGRRPRRSPAVATNPQQNGCDRDAGRPGRGRMTVDPGAPVTKNPCGVIDLCQQIGESLCRTSALTDRDGSCHHSMEAMESEHGE